MAVRHKEEKTTAAKATASLTDQEFERFIDEHGIALLATARRFSTTAEDAEDTYQLTLERVLTSAPTDDLESLAKWAKTVARNVALDELRRSGRHAVASDEADQFVSAPTDEPVIQLVANERDRQLTQAIRRIRPDQARCLLLRATGRSYPEICAITGFSYAKVNRCLSEGRKSLLDGMTKLSDGSDCRRLSGALSMYADGVADARATADVELHLESCLACQFAVREYRSIPGRVAATIPVGAVELADASLVDRALEPFRRIGEALQSVASSAHDAVVGRSVAFQQFAEAGGAKQAAIVVGVSASLVTAGAGIGVVTSQDSQPIAPSGEEAAEQTIKQEPTSTTSDAVESKADASDQKKRKPARDATSTDVDRPEAGDPEPADETLNAPPEGQSAPADDGFDAPPVSDPQSGTDTNQSAPDLSP